MDTRIVGLLAMLLVAGAAVPVGAGEWDLSGSAGAEGRWFVDDPRFDGQFAGVQGSWILAPEWDWESENRRFQLKAAPFLRVDARDDERTHFDLREAYGRFVHRDWEFVAGINRVFWGVTESRHLVDVINQVDAVEDVDEEDRLGQPMLQVSWQRDWGRLEGFLLAGFRERTFAGVDGRLRPPLAVDTDDAEYESGAGRRRLDFALRYSHFFGDWDVGFHFFRGNGREPRLLPNPDGDRLVPFYDVIDQIGTDVQYTRGAWLWKLEGLVREGQGDTFAAAVGGFEYTFYQVGGSAADVGLLAEILRDGRDDTAPAVGTDDDVFVGSRLALNDTQDTQALVGAIVDREDGSIAALLEAERRLGGRWKIELESRLFLNVDETNTLSTAENDSSITLRISRYF